MAYNIQEKKRKHCAREYHQKALESAEGFKSRFEKPESTLPFLLDKKKKEKFEKYKVILEKIARAVHFCGRQAIALRGHREEMTENDPAINPGNFIALLKEISVNDPILKEHLEKPLQRNATYLRMQSQNEMIDIIGRQTIQADLVEEVKEAGFHSIIVDEVTSSNDEFMSVCIRFVDKDNNIREVFLGFLNVHRITGEALAEKVFNFYEEVGLNVSDMRGQCFDGASNMSGQKKGLSAFIQIQNSKAVYTHCNSHILNLSIASASKLLDVQTVLAKMTALAIFFNYSPKKERLLDHIATTQIECTKKRKVLVGLCKTRWSERDTAYEHFYVAFPFLVTVLEIINGTHDNLQNYDDTFTTGWTAENKKDATAHLSAICNFSFIVTLVSIYRLLHPLHGTTVKLQGRSVDIVQAFDEIEDVKLDLQSTRDSINTEFGHIFRQAVQIADHVGIEPSLPRIARKQIHRSNPPYDTPEEYYRRTIAIPLLDSLLSELDTRFSALSQRATKLLFLVPTVMCSPSYRDEKIFDVVEMYKDDLLNPDIVDLELKIWKRKWTQADPEDRPSSLAKTILKCDITRYPNLFILLKIASTLPVTSCECERSFSVLRRLRLWLRASMGTSRLSSLALMNIHYGHPIDYKNIVDKFLKLHPRRLDTSNLVFHL